MIAETKMEMLMRMENNRALHKAQLKMQRLLKDRDYNTNVLAKELARKAEYNKRFENKAEVI